TEGALVVAAARVGLWKDRLEDHFPRVGEIPFSSERRRMSTVHRKGDFLPVEVERPVAGIFNVENPYVLFVKGGVDSLLGVTSQVWVDGVIQPLDEHWSARVEAANNRLAQQGLRVLGVAFRVLADHECPLPGEPWNLNESAESNLVLVGLLGLLDPPRAEVKEAVKICREAGIRPVMITGDHPLTALQIARMLNIASSGDRVLTGQELDQLSPEAFRETVESVSVYARVSPEHKLRIVEALQNQGQVTSMTGDGVNDAPALRKADIGVAMGITGTDVSKEAASMVILDDNFATIVNAVEEGRRVYENVRKFIRYTLGSNAGEILVVFFTPFLGMPIPLTPLQILWMNLVTDGFPGLALTTEPPERDIMRRPPVHPKENIFARGVGTYIFRVGIVMA
ncbi:HAD family hydrolase, partial [bacterium]|nr:HAD family hydrolase [bacterium]